MILHGVSLSVLTAAKASAYCAHSEANTQVSRDPTFSPFPLSTRPG